MSFDRGGRRIIVRLGSRFVEKPKNFWSQPRKLVHGFHLPLSRRPYLRLGSVLVGNSNRWTEEPLAGLWPPGFQMDISEVTGMYMHPE